ncbi:MAG: arginine biosynthesis protein ArgJ, partial [Hydrogenoanaerobacterium sp.]
MELAFTSGGVTAPVGFTASGVHCGIRKNKDKKDLALIYSKK